MLQIHVNNDIYNKYCLIYNNISVSKSFPKDLLNILVHIKSSVLIIFAEKLREALKLHKFWQQKWESFYT